jgi:hypothetical protein
MPQDAADASAVNKGMAPQARLSFFDMGNAAQPAAIFPPNSLTTLFQSAFNDGARIHSNSWGGNTNVYSQNSRDVDAFMFANQDFVVLFAAGNSGLNTRTGTIGTPGTAKSCITVGASLNSDRSFASRQQRCPVSAGKQGNCAGSMAFFSSTGPTSDGRTKPDVVAPGHSIASARSNSANGVAQLSGTSMATPATAGNTALVRQFLREGRYPSGKPNPADGFVPMGALLKAMLVNGADSMLGGEYGATPAGSTPATPAVELPIEPNVLTGFGRVHLDNNLLVEGNQPGKSLLLDGNRASMPTMTKAGDTKTYSITVAQGASDLKATLVWSDPAAAVGATKTLINDLDIKVTDPSGKVFFPNGRAAKDNINTVEQVVIPASSLSPGTYTVTVSAASMPTGQAQPFAVAISAPMTNAVPPIATPTPAPAPAAGGGDAVTPGAGVGAGGVITPGAGGAATPAAGGSSILPIVAGGVGALLVGLFIASRSRNQRAGRPNTAVSAMPDKSMMYNQQAMNPRYF